MIEDDEVECDYCGEEVEALCECHVSCPHCCNGFRESEDAEDADLTV